MRKEMLMFYPEMLAIAVVITGVLLIIGMSLAHLLLDKHSAAENNQTTNQDHERQDNVVFMNSHRDSVAPKSKEEGR